jgi:glutamate synthase (NADPH/NADH) small chain
MYGIPNMKLDKGLVQRRIDLMVEAGIKFIPDTEIGKDVSAARLRQEFSAIVLCTGATRPRDLPLPGRELKGIHFAMDFLGPNTKKRLGDWEIGRLEIESLNLAVSRLAANRPPPISQSPFISAEDRNVIIIGGGDTGTDCVATALRQGCASLMQFEIMERPPDERTPDNPWPQWPLVFKQDYGQMEAEAVYGRDPREFSILSKRFIGNDKGEVQAIETVQVQWQANGSGPKPVEIAGTERVWPAQLVLLAMGFLGPEGGLLAQFGVECDERTNAKTAFGAFQTNVPGVFAAGDARRGQSLVVWAINEGRGAAREVDRWLMGETDLP